MSGPIKGRGASLNPPNRFQRLHFEPDDEQTASHPPPETAFFLDTSTSIITYNDSPEVGFDASINIYRGCEHGCAYCYARPTHEYLGFSAGLDFETKIMVKQNAPELLRRDMSHQNYTPQPIAMSGVSDPYQPVERRLKLARECLRVLCETRNPVAVVTKNQLVTRDADILGAMASMDTSVVYLSITTLQSNLRATLEPRTSHHLKRFEAVETLSAEGIPCGVLVAPVIPGLTDHEIPSILERAADAGARYASYIPLRLPYNLKDQFHQWLSDHYPDKVNKVLNRIKSMRDGLLNDPNFGSRMRGSGEFADEILRLFQISCDRYGLSPSHANLTTRHFRRPGPSQLSLFE